MKKVVSLILVVVLCLAMVACGKKQDPRERLEEAVQEYVFENYRISGGGENSTPVSVKIEEVTDIGENKWAVLGTYTVSIQGQQPTATFMMEVRYDEQKDEFTFSEEVFSDFE